MKRIQRHFLSQIILFSFTVPFVFSQARTKWVIVNSISTFNQSGVVNPVKTNFIEQKKLCIGHLIYQQNDSLIFSGKLKKSEYYESPLIIGQRMVVKVKSDDDLTIRYPGDELMGKSSNLDFVGASFMRLLGSSPLQRDLTFYKLTTNLGITGAFCEIEKNRKMGLYLNNNFVILILRKVK